MTNLAPTDRVQRGKTIMHKKHNTEDHIDRVMSGRKNGYGMNLYRNTRNRFIAGVCSGLADHFEIDANVMRILFVAIFIVTSGALAFWAYTIAWILLSPKPRGDYKPEVEYDESEKCYRKKKIFRYRESPSVRIQNAKQRLNRVVSRVEEMENYVTSNRYRLDKEFADLEK